MSQTQGDKPAQLAVERAEAMLESLGQRFGFFSARAVQRIQQAASSIRQEADQMDTPESTTDNGSNGAATKTAGTHAGAEAGRKLPQVTMPTARAEEVVDQLGQRISQYATITSLQAQRAMARLREDAEDMWAEAQNIRQQNSRTPH